MRWCGHTKIRSTRSVELRLCWAQSLILGVCRGLLKQKTAIRLAKAFQGLKRFSDAARLLQDPKGSSGLPAPPRNEAGKRTCLPARSEIRKDMIKFRSLPSRLVFPQLRSRCRSGYHFGAPQEQRRYYPNNKELYIYTYIYIYVYTHNTYVYIYIYTYICMYMYIYIYTI